MSLDVTLSQTQEVPVFEANITHNLSQMAVQAGIYNDLWCPDHEPQLERAAQLIPGLTKGLELLRSKPEFFKQFDAKNGWGTYEQFVPWVERYLQACKDYPDAKVSVDK